MEKTVKLEFSSPQSHIAGLHLQLAELSNHGAPCRLVVEPGKMPHEAFWDCMSGLNNALNSVEDTYPLRGPEISSRAAFLAGTEYPNYRGRHVLAGGDNAYIDTIRLADAELVARKALRELRAMKVIDETDYQAGLAGLDAEGLNKHVDAHERHNHFDSDSLSVPSYKHSISLPRATVELLEEGPPQPKAKRTYMQPLTPVC